MTQFPSNLPGSTPKLLTVTFFMYKTKPNLNIFSPRIWLRWNFYSWLSSHPVFCCTVMSPKSSYNRKGEKKSICCEWATEKNHLQKTGAMQAVTGSMKLCPMLLIPRIKKHPDGCLHFLFRLLLLVPLGAPSNSPLPIPQQGLPLWGWGRSSPEQDSLWRLLRAWPGGFWTLPRIEMQTILWSMSQGCTTLTGKDFHRSTGNFLLICVP